MLVKKCGRYRSANATYVFGLKGNQESLYAAAQRVLNDKADQAATEAQTPWKARAGRPIRRELTTTTDLQNFETSVGVWTHLTQVWPGRQTTKQPDGTIVVEDHYSVTNIAPGRLTPRQKLTLVRAHWRIESDAVIRLDMQCSQECTPWCPLGAALGVFGLLRCMAYNLVQHLRRCHLRTKTGNATQTATLSWSDLSEAVRMTVTSARILADHAICETSCRGKLQASHSISATS